MRGDAVRPAQHESAAHRPGAATGQRIASAEVEYIPYGPPDEAGLASCEVVATFGSLESEYAAIRTSAASNRSTRRFEEERVCSTARTAARLSSAAPSGVTSSIAW
ncbi:MAG: hypothetical protein ACYSTY_09065 [Planctomycetota bacterium]